MPRFFCAWPVLLLLGVSTSNAQEVRASISGIVTDPTGAPVVRATVKVTNVATNTAVVAETNETGSYLTPYLPPGAYLLTVEHPGFKNFLRENIVLESLDKVRLDIGLELGALCHCFRIRVHARNRNSQPWTNHIQ